MYNNVFFAIKEDDGNYSDIYSSLVQVNMCNEGEPVFELELKEDKEKGNYWCWKDFVEKTYSLIQPSKTQVEICSPDFFKTRIEKGKGELVQIVLKEIKKVE